MKWTSSQRFRLTIRLWLAASLMGIVWNLVPVFAKYSLDQKKLAELEEARRHPPEADVEIAADSPWPGSTIRMTGQPVGGLDDANLAIAQIHFGRRQKMVIAHRQVSVIELSRAAADVVRVFPDRKDTEHLFAAVISGDGKVIATVGEFTRVSFWNATTGRLLQTIEDDFPTAAAVLDRTVHSRKHTNSLRYSSTGARLLTAAPGGCLFAIGKMDGTVEIWTAEGQALPDRPDGLVTPEWPFRPEDQSDAPKRFRLLRRMSLHDGEIRQLVFSLDCKSLVSLSGRRLRQMQEHSFENDLPPQPVSVYDDKSTPQIMKTDIATGTVQWKKDLPELPTAMAVNPHAQAWKGLLTPAQVAVALENQMVTIISLDDGSVLKSFSTRFGNGSVPISSMAFGDGNSLLWTVGTRYRGDAEFTAYTSVSAWDAMRGQRIVTAEVPGQTLCTGWDLFGTQLATVRYFHTASADSLGVRVPWAFHLWNLNVVHQQQTDKQQSDNRSKEL